MAQVKYAAIGALLGLIVAGASGQSVPDSQPTAEPPTPVAAETAAPSPETLPAAEPLPPPKPDFWHQSRLTGDWGGARTALESAGFSFDLYYVDFYGANVKGGKDTSSAARNSASYDWFMRLDLGKMKLIPGGSVFSHVHGQWGTNINPFVGALSDPIDDADEDESIFLPQLYYQQKLFGEKVRLRVGQLDYQTLVDRNAYANSEDVQFMSTYLDNDNATIPLPNGIGAALLIDPVEWLGFLIGACDKDAKLYNSGLHTAFHDDAGYYGFWEVELRPKLPSSRGKLPGHYRVGVIYDPRTKEVYGSRGALDDLSPRYEVGDVGLYASFDQLVFREGPNDEQGLGLFFRCGFRDDDVNRLASFYSGGLQYLGLIPGRNKDTLGFGMYTVGGSDVYEEYVNHDFERESGYELYYAVQVTPWMTLTPDVQYVVTPGGLQSARDAVVLGLRARISF